MVVIDETDDVMIYVCFNAYYAPHGTSVKKLNKMGKIARERKEIELQTFK